MPKTGNPRVQLVKDLRTLKYVTGELITRWSIKKTIYVSLADRNPGENLDMRDRLPQEYPENSQSEWQRLAQDATDIARAWERLAATAQQKAKEAADQT